jgi:magnesium-transporting ATPase (P-type)
VSASPGEIQTWHPLVSAMRIINVKLKKVHLQSTNLTYVQFQIVNINETENTDKDKTVSYVKYVWMTTMIYKTCNTTQYIRYRFFFIRSAFLIAFRSRTGFLSHKWTCPSKGVTKILQKRTIWGTVCFILLFDWTRQYLNRTNRSGLSFY